MRREAPDLGLWTSVSPARLLMPIDTHIENMSRALGLTRRRSRNWRMAEEITARLAALDPADPVKYDFALCHTRMAGDCRDRRDPVVCPPCGLRSVCRHWRGSGDGPMLELGLLLPGPAAGRSRSAWAVVRIRGEAATRVAARGAAEPAGRQREPIGRAGQAAHPARSETRATSAERWISSGRRARRPRLAWRRSGEAIAEQRALLEEARDAADPRVQGAQRRRPARQPDELPRRWPTSGWAAASRPSTRWWPRSRKRWGGCESQSQQLESKREGAYATLEQQLSTLRSSSDDLRRETLNLVTALRGSQVRGRWGELTLRRVVELAGLAEHCDFDEQVTLKASGSAQRPDMVVHLPGEREIVVDAKVPLAAYLDALDAARPEERNAALLRHAAQMRQHMNTLSGKAYWAQFASSLDLVVMFVPGEAFVAAAAEQDRALLEDGMGQRVVVATPTTLIVLLRSIAFGWKQERLAASALEIRDLGRELYERLRTLAGHVDRIGVTLGQSRARLQRRGRLARAAGAAQGARVPRAGRRRRRRHPSSQGHRARAAPAGRARADRAALDAARPSRSRPAPA